MNTRFLTILTTLAFLGFTVSAFAKGKPGGGGGGDLGPDIPMDCLLVASDGDTIKNDVFDYWYEDGVDKVNCYIGGPSVPWPIRLQAGGGRKANVRNVDLVLDDFETGSYVNDWETDEKGVFLAGTKWLDDL